MSKRIQRALCVLAIVVTLLAGLTGCSANVKEVLWALLLEWLSENAVAIGVRAATGSSGDPEVDAVMDARGVIDNINEADKLMEKGRTDRDAEAMGQAVKKRPGDWTYRVSYGALLLETGAVAGAQEQYAEADRLTAESDESRRLAYANQRIAELEGIKDKFAKGFKDAYQCESYFTMLGNSYVTRYGITKAESDLQLSQRYQQEAVGCR